MTVSLAQPQEIIHLSGISWQTYETLLKELSDRRLRLTYNRGYLEIMAPSYEHENYKEVLGDFVKTIAQELKVKIAPCGSTTFKVAELGGSEPDACFYIKNISAIKGKKRIDLETDPPPDLVVEIDITSSSRNRFQVYADMGVPEIWLYDGKSFSINILQDLEYVTSSKSLAFPNLPLSEINRFLQQAETKDYLELIAEFRDWVKSKIQQ
ncbi:Uma2 family endonuclease [Microseira sp. BLCC-F43]|jgi:Uma2 family endonuclease|uniref:Uma2 family endonuclease n=1 Tax=Microseira sp. BLCC-F43 TaxID=3153602 RepID=UPI0035BB3D52